MINEDKTNYVITIIVMGLLGLLGIVIGCFLISKQISHVEMWIGLYGALIGGFLTMIGVLISVNRQRKLFDEEKRQQAMPLLGFEFNDKLSRFNIIVSLANANPVFDLHISEYMVNQKAKPIPKSLVFTPCRLVGNEKKELTKAFDKNDLDIDSLVIRFQYKDIYENYYFQDLVLKNQSLGGTPIFVEESLPAPVLLET